jgi:streptogramin lyase/actin-like ATPase involved in cell morphogenesis
LAYTLGIDVGTTFTAVAVGREGRAEIAPLGSRGWSIPSVVYLGTGDDVVVGEAAVRRATTDPNRVAREFKRRIGDPVPVVVGGAPMSADALTGILLRAVVDQVTSLEVGQPDHAVVTHPANWGPFKTDLLHQAIRMSGLDQRCPTSLLSEPEAAAVHYAANERLEPGQIVAVYDLGGGTFDAAVLRRTPEGWEMLGPAEGIERLGGIDFDEAIFHHVDEALDGKVTALDPTDAAAVTAVAQLRRDCIEAKEALSTDTAVSVAVALPNVHTEVRLTRAEFEDMLRPALTSSVEALGRALGSANVQSTDLHSVLLVGGSSRIPLVGQVVAERLRVPVAADAHPKHSVALGAALMARQRAAAHAPGITTDAPAPAMAPAALVAPAASPAKEAPATPQPTVAELSEPAAPPAAPAPADLSEAADLVAAVPPPSPPPVVPPPPPPPPPEPVTVAEPVTAPVEQPPPPPAQWGATPAATPPPGPPGEPRSRRPLLIAAAAVVALVVIVAVAAVALGGGGGGDDDEGGGTTTTTRATGTTTPRPAKITKIGVGSSPDGLAVFQGQVWVSDNGEGKVSQVDAKTAKELDRFPIAQGKPEGMAAGTDGIWVALLGAGLVVKVDPTTGAVVGDPIQVGGRPNNVAVAAGTVWVSNHDGSVARINESDGTLVQRIAVGKDLRGIAVGTGGVWVADSDSKAVFRIDPTTNRPSEPLAVDGTPDAVAIGQSGVWVTVAEGKLVHITPANTRIDATIDVGGRPRGIAIASDGMVWYSNLIARSAVQFDPKSRKIVHTYDVGTTPDEVVSGAGAVWMGLADENQIAKIES